MLNYTQLDNDQLNLIDRIYDNDVNFIYATMGSGKTVCALTAVSELLNDTEVRRVLIIAPLRPAIEVWASEHKKWSHLEHLNVALACGNPKQRLAAIKSDADIVVINIENLVWFFDAFKHGHGFDCLVIDELSKFGNNGSKCVKKLKTYTNDFKHKTGLTASPTHEGFDRLYAQTLVLDGGTRFGRNKQKFLETFFFSTDYEQRNWELIPNMEPILMSKIEEIFYSMPDYTHTLPLLAEKHVHFELTEAGKKQYSAFKSHSVLELGVGTIVADNAAVLSGKLEQLTSGFVYCDDDVYDLGVGLPRKAEFISLRMRLANTKCLIFYTLEEEKEQIKSALMGNCSFIHDKGAIERWNKGAIDNLVLHPKSASHGLNLASGGHTIICYSPIWSNDAFKQLVARVWRRGQVHDVSVFTLVCDGTVDEVKVKRITDKEEYDKLLRAHIKGRI
jgi:thymidine kinase